MKETTMYLKMPFDPRDPASFGSNVPLSYVSRPSECHKIRLRIHHGGEFVGHLPLELKHIKGRLKPLNYDKDVLKFSETVKGLDVLNVFVEHFVDIPIHVDIEGNENANANENGTNKAVEDYEMDISDRSDEDYVGDVVDNMDTSDEEDFDYDEKVDELEDSESNVSLDDLDYHEQWDWTSVLLDETQIPNKNKKETSTSTTNSKPQTQTQATTEVQPSQVFEQKYTSTITSETSGIGTTRKIPTLGINGTQESTHN
ncbi:hypothetical protein SESBI_10205 [Sesbania bispinosa]|nr:hypothetical protein SESBI_10205 [Sesbania bispinosa]